MFGIRKPKSYLGFFSFFIPSNVLFWVFLYAQNMANFEVFFPKIWQILKQYFCQDNFILVLISYLLFLKCVVYNNKHHITGEVISKPHKRERERSNKVKVFSSCSTSSLIEAAEASNLSCIQNIPAILNLVHGNKQSMYLMFGGFFLPSSYSLFKTCVCC